MGVFSKTCSICSRRDILETVNGLLEQKVTFKEISRRLGGVVSKSSIGRHSQKCLLRMQAAQIASEQMQEGDRLVFHYAYQPMPKLTARDWLVEVRYEPELPPKPPLEIVIPAEEKIEEESVPPETEN